jgi:hypothetical protein
MALATALAGCGSSAGSNDGGGPTTPSPNTTLFQGTIAGAGGQSGTLSLTIATTLTPSSIGELAVSQVTGTVHLTGGSTTSLSGTYDSSTSTVSATGGGFAFTGTVTGSVLSGKYTAPTTSGGFSSLNGTSSTVTTYCGTYGPSFYTGPPANPPGGEVGVFNVQIAASGAASGAGVSKNVANDPGFVMTGQLVGTTLTLSVFDLLSGHSTGIQTMTVQGGTITGSCAAGCAISASTNACQ